jgi:tetratricopeptide (TPR) repeat protein
VFHLQRHEALAALTQFRELLNTPLKDDLRQEVRAKYRQALLSVMGALQEQGEHTEVLRAFFTHKGVLSPQEAESADFLLPVALSYARLGLLSEAQSLLQTQMRSATLPQHRGPMALEQAHILMAGGMLQEAYSLLKSTAPHAEGATRGQILITLGKLALRLGQAGEAVQYLRQGQEVITSPAERATLFALLGEAYVTQGREKEGGQAFQQCAETAPAAEPAPFHSAETCLLRAAEFLFAQRQYQPALALYQKLLATVPHTSYRPWVLLRLAAISQGLGDTAQMQHTLETLRDAAPSPLWQKVAINALEDAAWQQQFRDRLAEFHNRLMR